MSPVVELSQEAFDKPAFGPTFLPDGSYLADAEDVYITYGKEANDGEVQAAWLNVQLGNFATLEGEDTVTTANGAIDLTQQSRRFDMLIRLKNGTMPEWALQDVRGDDVRAGKLVRLAVALGAAGADEGRYEFPEDPEDLAATLQEFVGTRVRCFAKAKVRERNGVVQKKDDGTPIRDVHITSVDKA